MVVSALPNVMGSHLIFVHNFPKDFLTNLNLKDPWGKVGFNGMTLNPIQRFPEGVKCGLAKSWNL